MKTTTHSIFIFTFFGVRNPPRGGGGVREDRCRRTETGGQPGGGCYGSEIAHQNNCLASGEPDIDSSLQQQLATSRRRTKKGESKKRLKPSANLAANVCVCVCVSGIDKRRI